MTSSIQLANIQTTKYTHNKNNSTEKTADKINR